MYLLVSVVQDMLRDDVQWLSLMANQSKRSGIENFVNIDLGRQGREQQENAQVLLP